MSTRALSWLVLLALLLAAAVPAQFQYLVPEKLERATAKDDNGLLQWAKFEDVKCPVCKGTGKIVPCPTCQRYIEEAKKCRDCGRNEKREAVCHTCAGTGKLCDPLAKVMCPGCHGAGGLLCVNCGGSGGGKDKDGKLFDCPICRGESFIVCAICEGKRFVDAAKLKPSLAEASAKDLGKALELTDAVLKDVAAFTPVAKNTRKEIKTLLAAVKLGEKLHPSFKLLPKLEKEYMKIVYAGAAYVDQEQREVAAMQTLKNSVEYYLKWEKRMLELSLARAEANEKALAEQGGK
jgi:hypothetical protein